MFYYLLSLISLVENRKFGLDHRFSHMSECREIGSGILPLKKRLEAASDIHCLAKFPVSSVN